MKISKNIVSRIANDIKRRLPIHINKYNLHYTMQCLIVDNEIIIDISYRTKTAQISCDKINEKNIDFINDILKNISKDDVSFFYDNNKLRYHNSGAIYICTNDKIEIDLNF